MIDLGVNRGEQMILWQLLNLLILEGIGFAKISDMFCWLFPSHDRF